MIKRIVLAGVLALALMIAVKDGRVLRETGLTGVCTPAQAATDGVQLEACARASSPAVRISHARAARRWAA